MHLWCRILPLATTALNLMRLSNMNPKLSAEATLNCAFDYNKTPLAPPGTKIIVHETPNQRITWAAHGVNGWYLDAAPENYCCHRTYITKTSKERIALTVEFPPHDHNMPTTSSANAVIVAAQDLVYALQNPAPPTPYATVCTEQADALVTLSQLFLKRTTTTARIIVPASRVAVPATTRPTRVLPTRR